MELLTEVKQVKGIPKIPKKGYRTVKNKFISKPQEKHG
jgi:hypothetical protein